jgi:hypothetical protein
LPKLIAREQAEQSKPAAPETGLPPLEKTTPVAEAASLRGLFDAWKAVAMVKPRVIEETRYMIEMLAGFLGHDDAAKMTRADLAR